MEYLPEKRRTQKVQVQKKEEKTRQFREYLSNNDVVLAVVKCISSSLTVNRPAVHQTEPAVARRPAGAPARLLREGAVAHVGRRGAAECGERAVGAGTA